MTSIDKMAMSQIAELIKTTLREEMKMQAESYKSLNETILALLTRLENITEQIKIERENFDQEKRELVGKIESLEKRLCYQERNERRRNIVIRGLMGGELKGKEIYNTTMENFLAKEVKVETKVREILKIIPDKDLMIVEMDSYTYKEKIMKNKGILKDNRKFKDVFLDQDRTFEERTRRATTRRYVKTMRDSGKTVSAVNGKWLVDGVTHLWCEAKNVLVPAVSEEDDIYLDKITTQRRN